jgi:hypothetical protein
MVHGETMFSFTGSWTLPHKDSEEFKFLKTGSEPEGVYTGFWEYYGTSIKASMDIRRDGEEV